MQKTSGHQKSLPLADSASPYVMKDLLDWVLTRPKENEDVGMPEFAAQFGFHSENSAHELFVQVLQSTAIPYAKRQRLIRQYDLWRDSKGEEFWADRAAAHRVRVSMKKAVGEIIKGSDGLREHYPFATLILRRSRCKTPIVPYFAHMPFQKDAGRHYFA